VSAFALTSASKAFARGRQTDRRPHHQDQYKSVLVKMKAGAEEAAKANGLELRSFAGKVDGDNDGQVAAWKT